MIMPFGKHRGKPLEDVPLSYMQWALENCSSVTPALRAEMERLLRGDHDREHERESAISIPTLASQWYRQLACEFHPDRGGSHAAMVAINRGRDLLLELAGVAR